jgi:hypothetical protein
MGSPAVPAESSDSNGGLNQRAVCAEVDKSNAVDSELQQLADAYKPVLWTPERTLLEDLAWRRFASAHPGACREDDLKQAIVEENCEAVKVREAR